MPSLLALLSFAAPAGSGQSETESRWKALSPAGAVNVGRTYELRRQWATAAQLYDLACRRGDPVGCLRLAVVDSKSGRVDGDNGRRAALLDTACAAGLAEGCRRRAELEAPGTGDRKARELLQKACAAGDGPACEGLSARLDGVQSIEELQGSAGAFEAACGGGAASGCAALGQSYLLGRGVSRDTARGRELLENACRAKVGSGCWTLARLYEAGVDVERDPARAAQLALAACEERVAEGCQPARDYYERRCDEGDAAACVVTGDIIRQEDQRQSRAWPGAVPFYDKACAAGSPAGCAWAGAARKDGWLRARDPVRAAEELEKGCNGGIAQACEDLGVMDLESRDARSAGFLKKACEAGLPGACTVLGARFQLGGGGAEKDVARAVRAFDLGCSGGDSPACGILAGWYYDGGDGLLKDRVRAAAYSERECDLGEEYACRWLGRRRLNGDGVAKDPGIAAELLRKACDIASFKGADFLGNRGEACEALARLYDKGRGVPRDAARAAEYRERAGALK